MDWERIKTRLIDQTMAGIAMLAVGWLLGTSETAAIKSRQHEMQMMVDRNSAQLNARRQFMNDATGRIEFLCNYNKDCRARFQPMQTPE